MINLMQAGNFKVFDGMVLSALSITKRCKSPIKLFVLTMDLTELKEVYKPITDENINVLNAIYKEANSESEVIKLDLTDMYKREFENSPSTENFYTPYTFLRLFADQIPEIPDKILYLDTDVMAYGNIEELYNIDISKYEVAMVKDYYGHIFLSPRYCNAGVILLNMKMLRKTKMLNKAMHLCATKKLFLNDQTAIHKMVTKKLIIDRKFNEQHKINKDTVIRHFAMSLKFFPYFRKQNIKPWNVEGLHNILKCHEFDEEIEIWQQIVGKGNKNKI